MIHAHADNQLEEFAATGRTATALLSLTALIHRPRPGVKSISQSDKVRHFRYESLQLAYLRHGQTQLLSASRQLLLEQASSIL